jgi:chitodextrinase
MFKANKLLAIIASFLFMVSMGSCGGGGGGGGTATSGNDSVSSVVGSTGGTLTTPTGNAVLTIPAASLSTNTTITISQSTEGDLPGGIIGSYEFKPDGLTFNAPVKISLKYDPTLIPEGINEGNLKLAYESGGDWIIISDSNVDTTNHIVSGQTTHFTKYSITPEKLPYDTFIGDFSSVKINSNGDITNLSNDYYSVNGVTTGMKWQCVEYVNRYYLQVYNKNIRIPGTDAKDYYKTATDRGLSAYPNDGSVLPQPGDILVSEGGTYGHVAIVREVTENRVYVAQQNWFNGHGDVKAPLSKVGNHLDGFGGSKTYIVKGWLRLPASTTDTAPPSIPTGLAATAVSSSQIDLSWNASTDNVGVAGYKIYDYYGTYLKSVNTTSTSFTGLNPNTNYCFTVSAYDAAGNESTQSNQACATTLSSGYDISGKVTDSIGVGLTGVTITLTGTGSTSTITDSNGNYTFSGAQNGYYTITPSKAGYTFSPSSRTVTVNNADVTGQDFVVTTVNLFFDDFNDNYIEPNKWTYGGNTVIEEEGMMKVETTVTDQGGWLRSKLIDISHENVLTITRKTKVHYANQYFDGRFEIYLDQAPHSTFGISYANYAYSYVGNGWDECPKFGFFVFRNGANTHICSDQDDVSERIEPVWDEWFDEKIVYNPNTGVLEYFINEEKKIEFNVGVLPVMDSYKIWFNFHTWGWWTGHYQYFDDIAIK